MFYLGAGDLFFAVDVHALANQPLSIVQSGLAAPLIMVVASGAVLVWPRMARLATRSAHDAI